MVDSFEFAIMGLTEPEEDLADDFVRRMHEIAAQEATKLDVWLDGGPVLAKMTKERFPTYTVRQKCDLMFKILRGISGALDLHEQVPGGAA